MQNTTNGFNNRQKCIWLIATNPPSVSLVARPQRRFWGPPFKLALFLTGIKLVAIERVRIDFYRGRFDIRIWSKSNSDGLSKDYFWRKSLYRTVFIFIFPIIRNDENHFTKLSIILFIRFFHF